MKHPNGHDAPFYSEIQATVWLAWLAHNMQRHGRTIFLIEQLQPGWLATRTQLWSYILTTRLIWGVLIGLSGALAVQLVVALIFGWAYLLLSAPSEGMTSIEWLYSLPSGVRVSESSRELREILDRGQFALKPGLIFGLTAGLMGGLWDGVTAARYHLRSMTGYTSRRFQVWFKGLIFALAVLIVNMIVFLLYGARWGDQTILAIGVLLFSFIFSPIIGIFWIHRSIGRNPDNEIHTVETIRFTWSGAIRGLAQGMAVGLFLGMLFGLVASLALDQNARWQVSVGLGVIFGLLGGLIGATIGGLLRGLRPGIRELKTIPNQGIRLSLRTAAVMGVAAALTLGLLVGLAGGWTIGLTYGVLGGLCIGLWFGGLDVFQHGLVRLLLWQAGAIPWSYARFLDFAANELNFLQKIGGGYMFIHRYLLEYFAVMDPPGQPTTTAGHNASQAVRAEEGG